MNRPNHKELTMTHELHDHDRGLAFDLSTLMERRKALKLMGTAALVGLVGCASAKSASTANTAGSTATTTEPTPTSAVSASTSAGSTAATTAASVTTAASASLASTSGTCEIIPNETAGPYPGDGSNGANVLNVSGVVRSDIRSSFGTSTTTAKGVPLTIKLSIVELAKSCSPLAGAAVYLWHCNIDGQYSMYSNGVTNENYLRGVQETDADGMVTFTSIFPAAYSGRWPHIHFEVFPSLAKALASGTKLATSQIALPEDTCELVFATDGYSQSVSNLAKSSLKTDNVFSDGWSLQTPTVSGDVANGFNIAMNVAV
jgi:protocatechuate 3,4-dioxygenase beta subunit